MKIWKFEEQKIIWGEAIAVLDDCVKESSIDLIFVDRPYNIGKKFNGKQKKWNSDDEYIKLCYQWLDLCMRKLKNRGSIYIMAATQYMPYIDIKMLVEDPRSPVGERRMGKPINVAVYT